MTNFRLLQNQRVCRRQFQIWWKWQKVLIMDRKHWEKEKLLVTSNFSFSNSVFKRLVSQGCQKVSLCGNGLKSGFNPHDGANHCKPLWQQIKQFFTVAQYKLISLVCTGFKILPCCSDFSFIWTWSSILYILNVWKKNKHKLFTATIKRDTVVSLVKLVHGAHKQSPPNSTLMYLEQRLIFPISFILADSRQVMFAAHTLLWISLI